MTDDEVATLVRNLTIAKLEKRDQQEVAGYFEVLDLISGSYLQEVITLPLLPQIITEVKPLL